MSALDAISNYWKTEFGFLDELRMSQVFRVLLAISMDGENLRQLHNHPDFPNHCMLLPDDLEKMVEFRDSYFPRRDRGDEIVTPAEFWLALDGHPRGGLIDYYFDRIVKGAARFYNVVMDSPYEHEYFSIPINLPGSEEVWFAASISGKIFKVSFRMSKQDGKILPRMEIFLRRFCARLVNSILEIPAYEISSCFGSSDRGQRIDICPRVVLPREVSLWCVEEFLSSATNSLNDSGVPLECPLFAVGSDCKAVNATYQSYLDRSPSSHDHRVGLMS